MGKGDNKGKFAPHMEAVARHLWGEPNKAMSTRHELRWGSHGARVVDLQKGTWFDHQENVGGGVLDLVERENGAKGQDAIAWLEEIGCAVDDGQSRGGARKSRSAPAGPPPGDDPPFDPDAYDGPPAPGPEPEPAAPRGKIVATYDYVDAGGRLLYQVCRLEPKSFRQRRPDDSDPSGWRWGVKGEMQVPYRLPELLEDLADGAKVMVVEGEKDVDRLRAAGVPATCNAGGAGKWPDTLTKYFEGARVVLVPDDDPQTQNKEGVLQWHADGRPKHAGQDHADLVGSRLAKVAKSVEILHLPFARQQAKCDVSDWFDEGGTVDALYDLLDTTARPWRRPFVTRFGAITWASLDDPGPEHEWLIKDVLTRGERSMVAGPSQSGKSFLTIDIAMAVARGVPWFGHRTLRGGVVYQAGEGGRGIKKRLRAYRKQHGLSLQDDLPFVLLPSHLDLHGSDDPTKAFIEECQHWSDSFGDVPLELVVVDTFSAATPGANENNSEDVSVVLERCDRISQALDCNVLLVHHMNADGSKPRGHTSMVANLENVLTCRKLDGKHDDDNRQVREVVVSKQKDGEGGARFLFVLPAVEVGRDRDGDPVTSCVVKSPNAGDGGAVTADAPPRPTGQRLTDQAKVFYQSVRRAIDEHGQDAPASLQLPKGTRVVEWSRIRAIYEKLTFEGEHEPDDEKRAAAVRKALSRHGTKLLADGIIGREKTLVWLTGKKVRGFRQHRAAADGQTTEYERAPADDDESLLPPGFDSGDLLGALDGL